MYLLATGILALNIVSFNIRYAANPQSKGEAPWSQRLPGVLDLLRNQTSQMANSFIGLQEVLDGQLTDILGGLNGQGNEWASIGVGRDDGKKAGEYSPILYRPSVWKLQDFRYFWLSETPSVPSKGWDAGSIRIVTIGIFQNKNTSQSVAAFNTHLDNAGTVARKNGAMLIVDSIRKYINGSAIAGFGPLPVYLSGDMNSTPNQEAYQVYTSSSSPLKDTKSITPPAAVTGPVDTFTGFNNDGTGRLDYIFVAEQAPYTWSSLGYATLSNIGSNKVQFSDHRPVQARLQVQLANAG